MSSSIRKRICNRYSCIFFPKVCYALSTEYNKEHRATLNVNSDYKWMKLQKYIFYDLNYFKRRNQNFSTEPTGLFYMLIWDSLRHQTTFDLVLDIENEILGINVLESVYYVMCLLIVLYMLLDSVNIYCHKLNWKEFLKKWGWRINCLPYLSYFRIR